MADQVGAIELGFRISKNDVETSLKDIATKAADTLKNAFSGFGISGSALGLDGLRDDIKSAMQDSVKTVDGLSDQIRSEFATLTTSITESSAKIEESLKQGVKVGMENGTAEGVASMQRTVSTVQIPKIKAELDTESLKQSLISVEGESNLIHERMSQLAPRIDELSNKWENFNRIQQGTTPQAQKIQDQLYKAQKEMQSLEQAGLQAGIRASAIEKEMSKVRDATRSVTPEMDQIKAVSEGVDQKFKQIVATTDKMKQANKAAVAETVGSAQTASEVATYSFNNMGLKIKATASDLAYMAKTGQIGFEQLEKGMKSLGYNSDTINEQMQSTFGKSTEELKRMGSAAKATSKEVSKINGAASKAGAGLKKFAKLGLMALGVRSVYMAIRKAVNLASESIGHMANQNKAFGNTMNQLTASFSTFKGSVGAAIAPLINALAPALMKVAQWATNAMNAVAMFFAKLTGQKSVMLAVGSTEQFTKATDKSAKSAKKAAKDHDKLKRTLAGFDDLEILSFGDSGADDSAPEMPDYSGIETPGPVFKEVAVDALDLRSKLSDLWASFKEHPIFGKVATSAEEGMARIQNSWTNGVARVRESWDNHMPSIAESTQSIMGRIAEYWANGWAYFTIPNIAGMISTGIDIGAALISNVIAGVDAFLAMADSILAPILDSINGFFATHGETLKENIYSTWETISEGVTGVIDGIGFLIREVFGGITDFFDEHGGEIEEMFTETWEAIWSFIEPLWQGFQSAAETIFGAIKEFFFEFAPQVREIITKAFTLAWKIIKPIWEIMLAVAKSIFGWLQEFWAEWGDDISEGFGTVWEGIKTVFGTVLDVISGLLDVFIALFNGDWEGMWEAVQKVASDLWEGLQTGFNLLVDGISGVLSFLGEDVGQIFDGIKQVFNGIVTFIEGVFSGDWEKAWNGIKEIFSGIWESLKGIVKAPMNFIIDGVNKMIGGINKVKIPDWVPLIGGKGFSIPKIPRLAQGGIVDQPTVAMVGEAGKEAVMPLENNTGWIRQLAMDIAEIQGGSGGSSDGDGQSMIFNFYLDDGTLIDSVVKKINRKSRQENDFVLT